MAIVKKNIWSLFYLIVIIGTIILSSVLYYVHKISHNEYTIEQENIVKMSANSINSVFRQYEIILDILGHQLTENSKSIFNIKNKTLLLNIVNSNPSIVTLSLINSHGEEIISSSVNTTYEKSNLIKNGKTKKSFLHTLKNNKMIVGRTYFDASLNKYIIPLQKAIRDKNGKVIAVMLAGLDMKKGFDFFIENKKNNFIHETFLFRDFDFYFQIPQKRHLSNHNIVNIAIPKNEIDKAVKIVTEKYNMNFEDIKSKELITTVESQDKREVLSSSIYIKRYELWLTSQTPLKLIHNHIYEQFTILILIFLLVNILIFYLFKYIYHYEKRKQEVLYYQATHDYLTNLYNRLFLSKEFHSLNEENSFSLFFIDMDNFKNINDRYGHNYGDQILIHISKRLERIKLKDDILVRYSGDEFIIITSKVSQEDITLFAENIIHNLSQPYKIEQYTFQLSASIGIAQFPIDGKSLDEVKRFADIAMYEAKKIKNTFFIFNHTFKDNYIKKSTMEEQLKFSLEKEEIFMVYQPQVNLCNELYGIEALVRWNNKKLGMIPPNQFIETAESIGYMNELGRYIMDLSIKEISHLQVKYKTNFQLSINISVQQFMAEDFYEHLTKTLDKYNFESQYLTLEVTENIFIEDIEFILDLLNKVKKKGIKISLDDFGTGYSSLSLLKKLPIDELKIDKSFIDDITSDKHSKIMAENIIDIGKNQNLYILAEGIETNEQKLILEKYKCDLFQGYYFSKPLTLSDLETYIQQK